MKTENDDGEGEGEESGEEAPGGGGEAEVSVAATEAVVDLLLVPVVELVPDVFDFLGDFLGAMVWSVK